jgi:hypothetical protein
MLPPAGCGQAPGDVARLLSGECPALQPYLATTLHHLSYIFGIFYQRLDIINLSLSILHACPPPPPTAPCDASPAWRQGDSDYILPGSKHRPQCDPAGTALWAGTSSSMLPVAGYGVLSELG